MSFLIAPPLSNVIPTRSRTYFVFIFGCITSFKNSTWYMVGVQVSIAHLNECI